MKQLFQHLTGDTALTDVPVPSPSARSLIVETRASLISAGTERMVVEFGRASLIEKVRSQPERVRKVLDKVRTDGVAATIEAVRARLDQPIALGYCAAGVVVEAGREAAAIFPPGTRVATNGPHAEYVRVPHTLAARIPDGVSFEEAAFTPVAAIALQGIRLAEPTLGETVVVYGLGLIGLLAVQLLRANGCRVIGVDRDASRLALGETMGATVVDGSDDAGDVAARVVALTGNVGADAVLLTLASPSDDPVHQAAVMSRKRGRLVLVGVTGLSLRREDFYAKELSFTVSCSYGPGRYDPTYEDGAQDYPLPFVRWTEQRNFEAVLSLMADRRLEVAPLITHRFGIERAGEAYDLIAGTGNRERGTGNGALGVVLTYPDRGGATPAAAARTITRSPFPVPRSHRPRATQLSLAIIGAGNFATRTLLPALVDIPGVRLHTVASGAGATASVAAKKFGFERVTTDVESIFASAEIDAVMVLTRHDAHAGLALRALRAGKHVFVEKPLALCEEELDALRDEAARGGRTLMVGFNRRFAPLTVELQKALDSRSGPLAIVITVNAGSLPPDHWTHNPAEGGGRIVGEGCHFIDLARALARSPIVSLDVAAARNGGGHRGAVDDVALLSLAFADGSVAAIQYLSTGSRSYPKERVECFFDGRTLAIDNWRRLLRYDGAVRLPFPSRSARPDKGHVEEILAWVGAVGGNGERGTGNGRRGTGNGEPGTGIGGLIPLDEIIEVSRWAIRAQALAREAPASRAAGSGLDAACGRPPAGVREAE